jgi:hypoxanthine phosphoribosyltransferase
MAPLDQRDSLACLEDASVGFRNDLKPFHVIFRATVTTLITAEQIQARINEIAARINKDYPGDEPLHFVAVLKGAFVFLSDLARALSPRPVTLDFIAVSSYGAATKSSGEVRLLKDLDTPLQGRDVIIVEDIVDTGLTLHYLQDVLRARDPRSLRTACLLSKPSRRKVDVAVEYIGFEIDDKFVVGYGLDHAGQFRHLPFIGVQD